MSKYTVMYNRRMFGYDFILKNWTLSAGFLFFKILWLQRFMTFLQDIMFESFKRP